MAGSRGVSEAAKRRCDTRRACRIKLLRWVRFSPWGPRGRRSRPDTASRSRAPDPASTFLVETFPCISLRRTPIEPVRSTLRLLRETGWEIGPQDGNLANVPLHLRPEQNGVEHSAGRRGRHYGIREPSTFNRVAKTMHTRPTLSRTPFAWGFPHHLGFRRWLGRSPQHGDRVSKWKLGPLPRRRPAVLMAKSRSFSGRFGSRAGKFLFIAR